MANRLRSILNQSIIQGKSPETFQDDLKDYLNKEGNYPIRRLLRTEMARMQNKSTLDKYKEAGVAKYRVITANDDRVCDECIDNALNEYDINDTEHLPPLHPQCRCVIAAII